MNVVDIIMKKRDGYELSKSEIEIMVKGISSGTIPDYQISAWAMAVYFQGMSATETRDLAIAMAYSGDVMDLSPIKGIKVDKHSTGGVGDKTTMVVIPLAAAAGIPVAKMSGRGLGHTGGTIDKFESIPGFKVERNRQEFIDQVNRVKAAVISQSGNLVPADKKLYAIRDVTATVESIPLIASSIMSKKIAAGAQGIVLDVKVGQGAFMKEPEQAVRLAETMVQIGQGAGRNLTAVITDMSQPLGKKIGNALEVKEAIDLLKGHGPEDLKELSILLAAHMLILAGKCSALEEAQQLLYQLLDSGQAFARFAEMVAAQEGQLEYSSEFYGLPQADIKEEFRAPATGYIVELNALEVGRAAMLLGAGREELGDHIDPAVGIELIKKQGDYVQTDDLLAIIHANDPERLLAAQERLGHAYRFSDTRAEAMPLVYRTVQA